jgi:hypothetical protein
VFYVGYGWARGRIGSNRIAPDGVPEQAFDNAQSVIRFERFLGLYREEAIQEVFLGHRRFIQFWNLFYPTTLFVVSLGAFVLLLVKRADVFVPWRNALWAMNAVALIGFACFPLMPPRLLDAPCPEQGAIQYGSACIDSELRPGEYDGTNGFGYVDTLSEYGGFWRFDSEEVASVSNQYAAMPSMHIGWATWSVVAIWPMLRRRWMRVAALLYPALTLFCIVVTANHYWIDGVGGLVAFGLGAAVGWGLHLGNQRRLDRRCDQLDRVDPSAPMPRRARSSADAHVWHC